MSEAKRTIRRAIDELIKCESRLEYNDYTISNIFGKFSELQYDTYDLLPDESEFQAKFIIEFLDETLDFTVTINDLESIEYEDDETIEYDVSNALSEIEFECNSYDGVDEFIKAIGRAIEILENIE